VFAREVRILFRKEWRQLLRSRGAMLTALLLPVFLLVIAPSAQILGVSFEQPGMELPEGFPLPPALQRLRGDPMGLARLMLPLFFAIGGMIVPMVAASYTVISERETRTLELLVALPVSIGQILLAKLLAIGVLAGAVTLVLFSVDAVLLLASGVGDPPLVLALGALLFSALCFSATGALLISLLAKDFRTANNLNGALVVPTILLTLAAVVTIPGTALASVLLAALFGLGAIACVAIAMKVVTFERLSS
jgi:ABC-2 type transport system permease protein